MLEVSIEFCSGRFHATPWGRHPREGEVEWPPSPWRLLRSLVSAYYRGQLQASVDEALSLLRKLAVIPEYYLPPAVASHTRQYQPQALDAKQLMLDAFVDLGPGQAVKMRWPEVELNARQQVLLEQLLTWVGYFGRAESWADLKASHSSSSCESNCTAAPKSDGDPVRVLAASEDVNWEHLCCRTAELLKQGWSAPPGSRWVTLYRSRDSLIGNRLAGLQRQKQHLVLAARYVYSNGLRPRRPLTLFASETIRTHLLSLHQDMSDLDWQQLSGKIRTPALPKDQWPKLEGHQHLYILPQQAGRPQHLLGEVLLYRRAGLTETQQDLLTRLPRRQRERNALHPLTFVEFLSGEQLSRAGPCRLSTRWRSSTPYVFQHHFRGGFSEAQLVKQIRRELSYFGLPDEAIRTVDVKIVKQAADNQLGGTPLLEYKTQRRERPRPNSGTYIVQLEFAQPIRGPIAIGYAAHFGLGQFEPADGQS